MKKTKLFIATSGCNRFGCSGFLQKRNCKRLDGQQN